MSSTSGRNNTLAWSVNQAFLGDTLSHLSMGDLPPKGTRVISDGCANTSSGLWRPTLCAAGLKSKHFHEKFIQLVKQVLRDLHSVVDLSRSVFRCPEIMRTALQAFSISRNTNFSRIAFGRGSVSSSSEYPAHHMLFSSHSHLKSTKPPADILPTPSPPLLIHSHIQPSK